MLLGLYMEKYGLTHCFFKASSIEEQKKEKKHRFHKWL